MPPPFYLWNPPASDVSVRLSLELVRRLAIESLEARKSIPRRGLEIGGLLLGRWEPRGASAAVWILDSVAVESEHRSGPSYTLSEADLERFDSAFAEHPDAIGLFRTQTRSEQLTLEPEDDKLFKRYFNSPAQLFLLIKPSDGDAVLFLPRNGVLTPAHGFPFRASELPAASEPDPQPGEALAPANVARSAAATLIPPAAAPGVEAGFPTAAGASAIAAKLRPAAPGLRPKPPGASRARMEEPPRRRWVVPAIAAGLGMIVGAALLQLGIRLWGPAPAAAPVSTHYAERQIQAPAAQIAPQRAAPRRATEEPAAEPAVEKRRRRETVPRDIPPRKSGGSKPTSRAAPPAEEREQARGRQQAERVAENRPSPFASPPLRAAVPARPKAAPQPSAVPPSRRQEPGEIDVTVASEPEKPSPSAIDRVVAGIPFLKKLQKTPEAFLPPEPTHIDRPGLSAAQTGPLALPVQVDVKVYVNEAGRVDYAEVTNGVRFRDMAVAALFAARKWTFEAASLGGKKVRSEVLLHFRFGPTERASR